MAHHILAVIILHFITFQAALSSPPHNLPRCPPFPKSNFTIHQYQLYPENAFWDPENCVVYFSALFNGSLATYDPYTDSTSIVTFPGITHAPGQHTSGLHYSPSTKLLSIVINSESPFLTGGANVSGDNWLIQYDTVAKAELWRANLTAVTQGKWGGFLDVAVDTRGNSYVISQYPKSILKVSPDGEVELWYPPQTNETTVRGYTGCVSLGDMMLVVGSEPDPQAESGRRSEVYRFDLTRKRGKEELVHRSPHTELADTNRLKLPEAYGGTVALVSQLYVGVTVLRSRDRKWERAEYLGTITSDFPALFERILPTTVQVGPRNQYMVGQYFPGQIVPGTTAGNRSEWPMFDVTAQVESLLRG